MTAISFKLQGRNETREDSVNYPNLAGIRSNSKKKMLMKGRGRGEKPLRHSSSQTREGSCYLGGGKINDLESKRACGNAESPKEQQARD